MGNTPSSESARDHQRHQRELSRELAEQATFERSPRRRRQRRVTNENQPLTEGSNHPSSWPATRLFTDDCHPIAESNFADLTNGRYDGNDAGLTGRVPNEKGVLANVLHEKPCYPFPTPHSRPPHPHNQQLHPPYPPSSGGNPAFVEYPKVQEINLTAFFQLPPPRNNRLKLREKVMDTYPNQPPLYLIHHFQLLRPLSQIPHHLPFMHKIHTWPHAAAIPSRLAVTTWGRPPDALHALYEADDAQSREFRTNIRAYNMALAFTSLGVKEDKTVNNTRRRFGGSAWVFRIQGQLSHNSGALEPEPGQAASYAQLYIYDPQEALHQRMLRNSHLRQDTIHAFEVLRDSDADSNATVRLRVRQPQHEHARQHNLPTADEVAVILPGDGSAPNYRDIILHKRAPSSGPSLYRIHEGHPAYLPLHYVLLFPRGEHGWHNDLWQVDPKTGRRDKDRITITKFAAYRIHPRRGEYSALFRGGRLFQQFLVDLWACADQDRLHYLRTHQQELRADVYNGIVDAFNASDGHVNLQDLGRRYVLPSSYIGGPRHMQQRFQDAMAIARRFRKVDLFITVTANPQWKEILDELLPGQTSYDRPDLVARVFHLKKKAVLEDITKHGIFGRAVAHIYTIEFQKRGLPHMHLLVFLADGEKLLTPEDIDSCISAEWPDPETQPLLFETVKRCMVHGPCGPLDPDAPCMENGRCTKFYPKAFQPFTRMDEDGYPLYRRREDLRTFTVGAHQVDNRWIIPYCPYLSVKYDCHINVECAVMLRSVKYPFKYIHKGSDRATLEYERDEITSFLQGRYLAASEAVWRLLHYWVHDQEPSVIRLQVHLPGQHLVTYDPNEDPTAVLTRAEHEQTMLTQFFAANRDPDKLGEKARNYTYQEFPGYFVWTPGTHRWTIRTKGIGSTIGLKGPTSFQDLHDGEWRACLQEAAVMQTGTRLRHLFATLLLFCHPIQPELLWADFRHHICDDLWHRLRVAGRVDPSDDDVFDYGLYLLDGILRETGKSLRNDFPSMPTWVQNWANIADNPLIAEQLNYDKDEERQMANANIQLLNTEQQYAFTQIMASIESNQGRTFFLNGPGGTGKTFLYKTLCNRVDAPHIHNSKFQSMVLPMTLFVRSPRSRLILWDEAPMQHRNTHEALERTLRDIRDCDQPFGGVTVVFGGDFQQTLPVVPKGTQEEIVAASLPRSYIWTFIQSPNVDGVLRLRQNMRLDSGADEADFARWLLDVGHGRGIRADGKINIPMEMQCGTPDALIETVYPQIDGFTPPPEYFLDRIILAARNGDVDGLNSTILDRMGGDSLKYTSADSIENETGDQTQRVNEIPVEYLRTLNAPGLPPGELELKLGCPLILLRNIAPARGLCNGTRLILRRASDRVLEVEIMGGRFHGEVTFIPRITLTPSGKDAEFAFTLRRRQFPVRLAFALTINKAQGQSVRYVGLDLRVPVFSHGQLYVALSRATSRHRIKVLLPDPTGAVNIVYPEVLMD
ncbi:hypothetical protein ONZ45_g15318 [Pleurotus djamor]|nr:hypothetical protein ONZ45_g15318 [Pleurotus djamor]